jgi:hypothetical protein
VPLLTIVLIKVEADGLSLILYWTNFKEVRARGEEGGEREEGEEEVNEGRGRVEGALFDPLLDQF